MRRASIENSFKARDQDMVESSSTRGSGYRPVSTSEGNNSNSRQNAPVYGTVKATRSPVTLFLLTAFVLSLSLLLLAVVVDMPIGDKLRAALFNSAPHEAHTPTSDLSKSDVGSLNSFGLRLFANLASGSNSDVVISPASVASALSMAAAGATKGSQNAKELKSLIGAGFGSPAGSSDPSVELAVANGAWIGKNVLSSYIADVKKAFSADVFPTPDSVDSINEWVSKATKGKIPAILNTLPSPLIAILVNAVYFRASWTTAFDPKNTTDAPFYGPQGRDHSESVATVKMMRLTKQRFRYAEVPVEGKTNESLQIVELPYGKKNEFAATVVVPTGKMTIGEVADLFQNGNTKLWDTWIDGLYNQKLDVLAMPRFKIEYGVKSLKTSLQQMGISAAFASSKDNPQFLKMTSDKDAYLDDVFHKATLECTEEGTVASAATAAVVMSRSLPRPSPEVVLDRPFLFAIRNRLSGALLFLSRVDKPVSP